MNRISRGDQQETESNPMAGLCIKRLRLVPRLRLGKVEEKKIPRELGLLFVFPPRAEGTEGGEAAGGALSLVTGVSASGV